MCMCTIWPCCLCVVLIVPLLPLEITLYIYIYIYIYIYMCVCVCVYQNVITAHNSIIFNVCSLLLATGFQISYDAQSYAIKTSETLYVLCLFLCHFYLLSSANSH